MASPVLTGTDNSQWPVVVPAGQWSPWITAQGTDGDAQTVTGQIRLFDAAGNASNVVNGHFTFSDPLRAELLFPAGTPAQIEYDPANPLRFRVRNANA